jgi:FlgN protein
VTLIAHLDAQIESTERLLRALLSQNDSIRRQDVEGVLARLGDIQGELANRQRLERERDALLADAGARLGLAADELDIEDVLTLYPAASHAPPRERSAQLKGLLAEVGRVHDQNQILIRQELSFLDHLLRLLSGAPQGGYTAAGYTRSTAPVVASLNVRA